MMKWLLVVLLLGLAHVEDAAKETRKKKTGGGGDDKEGSEWGSIPYEALVATCKTLGIAADGTQEALADRLTHHFESVALNTNTQRFHPYVVPAHSVANGDSSTQIQDNVPSDTSGSANFDTTTTITNPVLGAQDAVVPGQVQSLQPQLNPQQLLQQQVLLQRQPQQLFFPAQLPLQLQGQPQPLQQAITPQLFGQSSQQQVSAGQQQVYTQQLQVPMVGSQSVVPIQQPQQQHLQQSTPSGLSGGLDGILNDAFRLVNGPGGVTQSPAAGVGTVPVLPVPVAAVNQVTPPTLTQLPPSGQVDVASIVQSVTNHVLSALGQAASNSPVPGAAVGAQRQVGGAGSALAAGQVPFLGHLAALPPSVQQGVALPQQTGLMAAQGPHVGNGYPSTMTNNPSFSSFPGVPQRFIQQIQRGECVNFNSLYSSIVSGASAKSGYSFVLGDHDDNDLPVVSLKKSLEGSKKIKNFAEWLRTWNTFLSIFVVFRPHLFTQMLAYQGVIARHANMYSLPCWLGYDAAFRQKMANNPFLRWDTEDVELFNAHLRGGDVVQPSSSSSLGSGGACFNCGKFGHFANECSYAPRSGSFPRPRPVPKPSSPTSTSSSSDGSDQAFRASQRSGGGSGGICFKWNDGAPCPSDCPRDHRCSFCRKLHPRSSCDKYANKQG